MKIRFYAAIFLLAGFFVTKAQDPRFSMFYASPLTLNPALTGNFDGLYRITGIYRDQWPGMSFGKAAYSTPSLGVDFSLLKDKIKNGALGVGLVFANDQQSGKIINQNYVMVSVAYNMTFGPQGKFQLGAGLQGGVITTKVDFSQLQFDEGFQQVGQNIEYNTGYSGESFLAKIKPKGAFNAGIFAKYSFTSNIRFYAGYGLFNASQFKDNQISGSPSFTIPLRNSLHGGFEFDIRQAITLIPGFYFQHSPAADGETEFGLTAGFHVVKNPDAWKRVTFFIGLWNRLNKENYTLIPKIGLDIKQLRLGFAYDAALAQQRADAAAMGGGFPQAFEVSLTYTGRIKPLKEDHYLFNPRM